MATGTFGFNSKGSAGYWHTRPDGSKVFVASTYKNAPSGAGLQRATTGEAVAASPSYTPPAASASAPLPVDPGYLATVGGLGKQRDNTIAGIQGQRTGALLDYGYQGSFDANGGLTGGLTFDPANPFSRAALLQKSYQQHKSGTLNSMAAGGQLYAGALQDAQDANDVNYQQGTDSLQKQLISYLGGLQGQQSNAETDYEINAGNALGTSTQNAENNPLYTPTPVAAAPALASRKVAKTVGGVKYYRTTSGKLAPIPKGAPIV